MWVFYIVIECTHQVIWSQPAKWRSAANRWMHKIKAADWIQTITIRERDPPNSMIYFKSYDKYNLSKYKFCIQLIMTATIILFLWIILQTQHFRIDLLPIIFIMSHIIKQCQKSDVIYLLFLYWIASNH